MKPAIEKKNSGKANLEVFSGTLEQMARNNKDIIVVTSDSRGSGKLVPFAKKFPAQVVETGIAEQNLVGISAGLASTGKKVFAVSPACFLTARSLEQIKNDVAYSDNPVNLIGISAGVSYGPLGSTHHSLHDFAVLRAIHNLIIVAPSDNYETEQAIRHAAEIAHPVYIRFGKKPMPFLNGHNNCKFELGKGRVIREGEDLAIVATGETVYPALLAAQKLERECGITTTLVSMHTVKPLDTALLSEVATKCKAIMTVEEHSIHGGLGEACASFLLEKDYHNPFHRIAIPDEYTITGSQIEIFNHYGISEEGIAGKAIKLLERNPLISK